MLTHELNLVTGFGSGVLQCIAVRSPGFVHPNLADPQTKSKQLEASQQDFIKIELVTPDEVVTRDRVQGSYVPVSDIVESRL